MKEGILVNPPMSQELIRQWDQFVINHPEGSFLQSWYAFELFRQTTSFEPVVVFYFQNSVPEAVLLGVIIKETGKVRSLFSSRLVVYGGPLIKQDTEHPELIIGKLLKALVAYGRKKSIFIQIRAFYDLKNFNQQFSENKFTWLPRINLLIDTRELNQVKSGISSSRKRQVKKSLEQGARVIEPRSLEDVKSFYHILKNLYQTRIRKPLPDWSFFHAFYKLINQYHCGKYFLVEFEGRIVGGIMIPFLPQKQVYEWYVCGLDREYKNKNIFPSVLATWSAIMFSVENKFTTFDFMGVGKPDVPYGVRDFKLTFGGTIVNYGRYIRINRPMLYTVAEIGYNILSFLKKV